MKNNIEKKLQSLQEIGAGVSLHKRIKNSIFSLPISIGFNYPLIAFRLALTAFILFIVGGSLSGIGVAARGSSQDSVLFPIKRAIVQTQIHFTNSEQDKATLRAQINL